MIILAQYPPLSYLAYINLDMGFIIGCPQVLSFRPLLSSILQPHPHHSTAWSTSGILVSVGQISAKPVQCGNLALVSFTAPMVSHFAPSWQGDMHRETQIRLKSFLTSNWENLHEEFILRAQVFVANSNSMPLPQHDPPTHKHLFHSLILEHATKYFRIVHALALFFLTPTSFNTTLALTALHPKSNGYFPLFLEA